VYSSTLKGIFPLTLTGHELGTISHGALFQVVLVLALVLVATALSAEDSQAAKQKRAVSGYGYSAGYQGYPYLGYPGYGTYGTYGTYGRYGYPYTGYLGAYTGYPGYY
jgi:hypothetical protein